MRFDMIFNIKHDKVEKYFFGELNKFGIFKIVNCLNCFGGFGIFWCCTKFDIWCYCNINCVKFRNYGYN